MSQIHKKFLENADQLDGLLSVLSDAGKIGEKTAENMDAVLKHPDKATNLKKVIDLAI